MGLCTAPVRWNELRRKKEPRRLRLRPGVFVQNRHSGHSTPGFGMGKNFAIVFSFAFIFCKHNLQKPRWQNEQQIDIVPFVLLQWYFFVPREAGRTSHVVALHMLHSLPSLTLMQENLHLPRKIFRPIRSHTTNKIAVLGKVPYSFQGKYRSNLSREIQELMM